MYIPNTIIIILSILIIGSWILISEGKSPVEKISSLIALICIYIAFRLLTGSDMQDIMSPLINGITIGQP